MIQIIRRCLEKIELQRAGYLNSLVGYTPRSLKSKIKRFNLEGEKKHNKIKMKLVAVEQIDIS